jgi:hypothetical protein
MMTFTQAVSNFANSLPGTDAYSALKKAMLELIKQDPLASSAYFLIAGFARTYVMLYEDQEIKPEFAKTSQQEMLGYLERLDKAIQSGDKANLLDAMNKVVSDYDKGSKVF